MSDLQTCLASIVVAAGGQDKSGAAGAERQIDIYLTMAGDDPRSALLELKAAFEEMRLDGQVASHIGSHLDRRMSLLLTAPLPLVNGG